MDYFAFLINLDSHLCQKFIQSVKQTDLAIALKAVEPEIRDEIFSCLPEEEALQLQDEMDLMGPVILHDVEKKQIQLFKSLHIFIEANKVYSEIDLDALAQWEQELIAQKMPRLREDIVELIYLEKAAFKKLIRKVNPADLVLSLLGEEDYDLGILKNKLKEVLQETTWEKLNEQVQKRQNTSIERIEKARQKILQLLFQMEQIGEIRPFEDYQQELVV